MAIPTVKSTYVLDLETLKALESVAGRWGVSKSEALRRAIRAAAGEAEPSGNDALIALDELQRSLCLDPERAQGWAAAARRERRAASSERERSGA